MTAMTLTRNSGKWAFFIALSAFLTFPSITYAATAPTITDKLCGPEEAKQLSKASSDAMKRSNESIDKYFEALTKEAESSPGKKAQLCGSVDTSAEVCGQSLAGFFKGIPGFPGLADSQICQTSVFGPVMDQIKQRISDFCNKPAETLQAIGGNTEDWASAALDGVVPEGSRSSINIPDVVDTSANSSTVSTASTTNTTTKNAVTTTPDPKKTEKGSTGGLFKGWRP